MAARRGRGQAPAPESDWFSTLFGFAETSYEEARRWLRVTPASAKPGEPVRIESLAEGGASYAAGAFSTPSLAELRKLGRSIALPGRIRVFNELGDVAAKHALPENRYATFQVASQFNCLEFVGPSVTPEQGITQYASDRTQGPACSIACGPATAFRNYFVPVPGSGGKHGQRRDMQIDNLADIHALIGNVPNGTLFDARGGYTLAEDRQLAALNKRLTAFEAEGRLDELRSALRIGVHADVQVTATDWGRQRVKDSSQLVTQVFGSACSVAYSRSTMEAWQPFARLILEASYEATLWAALLNAQQHGGEQGSRKVFLTCLGGGAFGNSLGWITSAMQRAISLFEDSGLEIRIVTFAGRFDPGLIALEQAFDGRPRRVPTKKPALAPPTTPPPAAAAAAPAVAAAGGRGMKRPAGAEDASAASETPEKARAPTSAAAGGRGAARGRPAAAAARNAKAKAKAGAPDIEEDVMLEASKLGFDVVLRKLLARPDVAESSATSRQALDALQAASGLLHPAKEALLAAR